MPGEATLVADAVDKRRREFSAGRSCARKILKQLGFKEDFTIGKDKHGAPLWPKGIVGSLSHTDDQCVVALARQNSQLTSLGVDVEKATGLKPNLIRLVCDHDEWQACHYNESENPYQLAKLIFSAKESVYKCLYPITKTVLNFTDVHVRLDAHMQQFTVTLNRELCINSDKSALNGKIIRGNDQIYTSCTLLTSLYY